MGISKEDLENEHRAELMARHALTSATWDEHGMLVHALRGGGLPLGLTSGQPGLSTQSQAAPTRAERTGGAEGLERMRKVMLEKRRAEHNIRFAHSHVKPRFEEDPEPVRDDVPRAIRAREADRAATPKRTTNRKTKR